MHVIFGISSLVMLGGTIMMLAKDHNREWTDWQLKDRSRQRWTIEAQLAQAEANSAVQLADLRKDLQTAQSNKVAGPMVEQFKQLVVAEDARLQEGAKTGKPADFAKLDAALQRLTEAADGSPEAVKARKDLLAQMDTFVHEAKRRENDLLTRKKFVAGDQTARISERGIAIGEGKPAAEIEAGIQALAAQIVELDASVATAKDYRVALETIVRQIQSNESNLQKQIAGIETDQKRLKDNLPGFLQSAGEWVNRGPVLDALYTGNIKLEQIWLPDMKINYNFSSVARYDRCIVCHRQIDATVAGSATEPAFPAIPRDQRDRIVQLGTPGETPKEASTMDQNDALAAIYGIILAERGQVDPNAVTVQVVVPKSLAAVAGLQTGDVLLEANGGPIDSRDAAFHYLVGIAEWGKPIALQIRRGLDQPYTSHPRLDLFVGSTSPHRKGEMGCTICHDGQGSATGFKWASHTPDDPHQALDWSRKYGWFDNHHWIFPMTPNRFIESNCLKCHHEVVELEPSERFPQPPAPKLVEGYHLVREYGCYGCHEISGFDGPTKRTGPDLRLEPNFAEVGKQILTDPGLSPVEREAVNKLIAQPSASDARNELLRSIRADAELVNAKPESPEKPVAKPRLTAVTHALADGLKDVEAPGSLRKVGPSLRHLNSKVDYNWLYSWIRKPADFRPTTRMPQFFLNHEHLNGTDKAFSIRDAEGKEVKISDLEYTKRFENIEIRSLAQLLLADSQPFQYIAPPQTGMEPASKERGKLLFETRGCLACHSHVDFANIHSTQGPDLSRLSAKLNTDKGQRWLYSWIKAPSHYYPRTVMPNLYLEPIAELDATGNPTGKVTDPAADIMVYLLSVPTDWKPEQTTPALDLTEDEKLALNDLTTVWLSASFPRKRAERYAVEGIPESLAATVKVDEKVLLGNLKDDPNERARRQLEYVGRRSISRYGCFGCHDIPGYEGAKPIGTPLASWGRKDPSQLAFENINEFLSMHDEFVPKRGILPGMDSAHIISAPAPKSPPKGPVAGYAAEPGEGEHKVGGHGHGLDPMDDKFDGATGYFLQSLATHQRHGFLWQKLRMPRSFDFETTQTKRYDERLRMPKFPFNEKEREAVMTFVLGLTQEAPASKYIYQPGPRQQAIVEGRHILHKYNCGGCHILDMNRWDISYSPNEFESPAATNDFPFVRPQFTADQIKASLNTDRRGMLHAELHGMPALDEKTGQPKMVDQEGVPIEPDDKESTRFYEFVQYQPSLIGGVPHAVGQAALRIQAAADGNGPARGKAFPANGGDLARYLYSRVIAEERKINPNAPANEAWGWLPPPLHNEGAKVQADWLHDFLMDPTLIRPAVVLRMPNFGMSTDEASKLVNYFAAKSNAEFPYEYNERRRKSHMTAQEQGHPAVLTDAMKIVTNGNYCVKCHNVGDFQVKGAPRAMAPNLDQVYRRLRSDYVRFWIGNPQRVLPYTGMPVNIPFDPNPPHFGGVAQDLFPGPSISQLDGVVDLLMNFDEYTRRQTSVKGLVKEPAAGGQPPAANPPAPAAPPGNRSASN